MEKIPFTVQEIVFSSSNKVESQRIGNLVKKGILKKIAPKIYTSNLEEESAYLINKNWFKILSHLYPGAIMSHQSALMMRPTPTGHIYLTYSYTKNIELPGLTIHFFKGESLPDEDNAFFGDLYVSNEARAYLENMQPSRLLEEESKTLSREKIEEKLEVIIRLRGESALNAIRDNAKSISTRLGMEKEYRALNDLISSLLTTGDVKNLRSPSAIARSLGEPYDKERVEVFEILYNELAGNPYQQYPDQGKTSKAYKAFGFFESYFSNYIEGTEFTVEEAKRIVTTQIPLPLRSEDSHDVLGTYRIVSDLSEMSILPKNADELLNILRYRHEILLEARVSKNPGEFKDIDNRAGNTLFVSWQLVVGTLKKGFDFYTLLSDPFAKAVYMMFLISEVHPFLDGNGRIARVMMNAELSSKGLSKIIIPTVYRDDYMGALRKLTRQRIPDAYVRMLGKAFAFSAGIYGEDIDEIEKELYSRNAFADPEEAKLIF